MRVMRVLAGLFALFLAAAPAAAQPVKTGHITAELVAERQAIAPGETLHMALRQDIQKGWHTYWRNAGDSGEPTRIAWILPPGWSTGDIVWPAPTRQPAGPLMNYGYTGEVLLPVALTAPRNALPGQTVTLKAAASFLVCEEICVPEDAVLTLALPVVATPAAADPKWGPAISATLAAAPKPAGLAAAFEQAGGKVTLAVAGAPLAGADMADAYFFPFDGTQFDHAKPQAIERGPQGLTLTLTPGFAFKQAPGPADVAGVLSVGGKAYEVRAAAGPPPPGASGLGPPPVRSAAAPAGADLGLALAALFAFVGGLILNLMPCVFPILAMKAASMAGHLHDAPEGRRQGLAFGAGVLATFLGLAGLLIALKAGGAAIGWGFQLQSPPVVAGLALLMLAVALNLSGVFEAGQSLQGAGAGLAARSGLAGAFFTGALAVVVAAPCTAPFMAPALGWALTRDAAAALAVFAALGLGFAAPFVGAAFAPGLLARLPRPGLWMDVLRKALAFPMYGTAAWLVWVLAVQAGAEGLARVLAASVLLALAAWLFGWAQRRRAEGGRPAALFTAAAVAAAVALAAALWPGYAPPAATASDTGAQADLPFEAWSPERVAAAHAAGKPVLVDFTAAWCVTCQVNERVALSTPSVADAFRRTGAIYLKGDWTRKDPAIAAELARHGRAGVPLYLVYGAQSGEGVILPQILTEKLVIQALEDAQRR